MTFMILSSTSVLRCLIFFFFFFFNHSQNETLDQVAKGVTCDQQGPLWAAGEGVCRWPTPQR